MEILKNKKKLDVFLSNIREKNQKARLFVAFYIEDIRIIAGGIIPDEEIPKWNEIGIEAIFGPGSSTTEIIDYINGIEI